MAERQATSSEVHGIQVLRAVAALAVVFHHTLEHSNGAIGRFSPDWLTTSGAFGVDIFFVISGFIMLFVSFRPNRPAANPGSFLFRRATRIYPFYWLCTLAMLIVCMMGFLKSLHYDTRELIASFLLLPGDRLIGVSWTLVYEIYFYLLFAVTLFFRSALMSAVGTTIAIAAIDLVAHAAPAGVLREFLVNPVPLEFCMGLWLAVAYLAWNSLARPWPLKARVSIIGFALMAAAPLWVAHANTNGLPPLPRVLNCGLPSLVIVASFLSVGPPRNVFTRFMALLGDASYALYLTHVFVMIGYGRLLKVPMIGDLPQIWLVPTIVLIATGVGLIAHLYVERPLSVLFRRAANRQQTSASLA